MTIELLQKVEVTSLGDKLHNEYIDILYNDVDKRKNNYKNINNILETYLKESNQRWLFRILTKNHVKRLNAIMKSKTEKTYYKKINRLIDVLLEPRYGYLFNKDLIELLSKEYKKSI